MGFATLEKAVLEAAKVVIRNPKLKRKDLLAWSTGEVSAEEGEVAFELPELSINVVVAKVHDKRQV